MSKSQAKRANLAIKAKTNLPESGEGRERKTHLGLARLRIIARIMTSLMERRVSELNRAR